MAVEIIARETIKPSSPTPKSLRNFKLSLIDQLTPPVYGSLLFFYSSNGHVSVCERSQLLKQSFSDALTLFYPLAGRTVDNFMIDCSDHGALYVEARVDCPMFHFLEKPNGHELKRFLPTEVESTEENTGLFSLVQATFFACGGVAIGVCISHKLADAATVGTFMRCWAGKTKTPGPDDKVVVPVYKAAALFPPRKFPEAVQPLVDIAKKERFPLKRFVFDSSRMVSLKATAASVGVERPSRAEVVTALIWKCALNAARSNSGSSRPSVLTRAVNIRGRISPPLPDNSVGNLVGFYTAQKDESEVDLQGLVHELRERLQVFDKNYVKMMQNEEGFEAVTDYFKEAASQMMRQDLEFYISTSLCNSSLYDVDFGWGRPVWVTIPSANNKNVMELIDTNKGDGSVEAWVVLSKEDMYLFERDPELLAYASLNPSVLDTVGTESLPIKSSI